MNIKYPLIMTHRNITVLVGAHWTVSVIWIIIEFTLDVVNGYITSRMFAFFTFLILDIIILISFLVTYSYFYSRVKKIKGLESNSVNQCTQNRQRVLFKKFKLPCYIVLTYICFNISSTIILTYSTFGKQGRLSRLLYDISDGLILVGFISDILIYVLANKNVCTLLVTIVRNEQIQQSNRVHNCTPASW